MNSNDKIEYFFKKGLVKEEEKRTLRINVNTNRFSARILINILFEFIKMFEQMEKNIYKKLLKTLESKDKKDQKDQIKINEIENKNTAK